MRNGGVMSKPILYSHGAVVEQICFMDEYMRAFMKARDKFAQYWCGVMGWDANNLSDEQFHQLTNHPDWRKPCVEILPYGHLTEDDEQKLRMYSKGVKCAVELGTFLGRGAAILSENAQMVVTIDNYNDNNFGGIFHNKETVRERLKNYKNIMVINYETSKFDDFKSIPYSDEIGFLFIDADHSYDGVKKDFEVWFPILKSGAFILFHDSIDPDKHPGVVKYVHSLLSLYKRIWDIEFIECSDGINGSITVFRKK